MKSPLFLLLLLVLPLSGKTLRDVDAAKHKAWEAYCQRLHDDPAWTLPALLPLSDTTHGAWPMDDANKSLMPFYYGSKGEGTQRPLFLYLHGSGPKAQEWATSLAWAKVFDDAPSVYFIPQIPTEARYRWYQREKQMAWEGLFRRALADEAIDPARLYIFGISEGGYGSQRLASFYADYIAAAGPMAGGEPLRNAPVENVMNIGFSLRTGELDNGFYRNRLTTYTREALDSIGHPHTFIRLEEGRGHGIDYRPTPAWLTQFKRNARPRTYIWEQFPMDDRYRQTWYNLYCPDTLSARDDERRRYEVRIADNVVEVSVAAVRYEATEVDPHWGIQLRCARTYTPAEPHHLTIYLDNDMIDTSRKVVLRVNGKTRAEGSLKASKETIEESIRLWGDPLRVFAMKIGY